MLKTILVCLDGTPNSEPVVRVALKLAHERQASLCGMIVVDKPAIEANEATGIGGSSFKRLRNEHWLAETRARAAEGLEAFERRCRDHGVPARVLEVIGASLDSILAESERYDLTILGRGTRFHPTDKVANKRVRDKILRQARRPFLVVPESVVDSPNGQPILVAYDGGKASTHALAGFIQSGLADGREVHVATFGDDGYRAGDLAEEGAQRLRAAGIRAFTHGLVSALPTCEAIIDLGRKLNAGFLVMGGFAHSRFADFIHRSGTIHIVEHSTIPLCIQH